MRRVTSLLPSSVSLLAALTVAASLSVAMPGPTAPAVADPGVTAPAGPPAPSLGTGAPGAAGATGATGATGAAGKTPSAVLERAARALDAASPEQAPEQDRVEATLVLRDLFLARRDLDGGDLAEADRLLARPTDGARDPYGDGYTSTPTRTCSARICVHYVRSGADAPPSDAWARKNLAVMKKVWKHHVGGLGYRTPARDGSRGGNAKFDVYLKDVGTRGIYGYCAPERRVQGKPKQASGFCVLDNDFAQSQYGRAPAKSLRVTAAHEFLHAIQFAYDFTEDQWLLESTATWIEERFADDVNDNRSYLRFGQAARSTKSLDVFEGTGLAHYGNWVFWEFLSQSFGTAIVRDVIEHTGTGQGLPDSFSTEGTRQVLADRGGLPRLYAAFAAANTVPARSYEEGSAFPGVRPVESTTLRAASPRTTLTTRINHLAAKTVEVRPGSLRARTWRLAIAVDGPRRSSSPAVAVLVRRADGTLQRRTIALDRSGDGSRSVAFSSRTVRSVGITLANASTRYACEAGSAFACAGRPLDQRQQFSVTARAVRG
jgi:hypothetical protein